MSQTNLENAREHFIQGMSRIANFWGFPKAMGAIYGAIYISPTPVSLNELVEQVGVTKGAISTNVRQLERLRMVHKHFQLGERKDFYIAETDFWKIIRSILKEREQSEFDVALNAVSESLALVENATADEDAALAKVYRERMQAMEVFFKALDNIVSAALKLESLISLSALGGLIKTANGLTKKNPQ